MLVDSGFSSILLTATSVGIQGRYDLNKNFYRLEMSCELYLYLILISAILYLWDISLFTATRLGIQGRYDLNKHDFYK